MDPFTAALRDADATKAQADAVRQKPLDDAAARLSDLAHNAQTAMREVFDGSTPFTNVDNQPYRVTIDDEARKAITTVRVDAGGAELAVSLTVDLAWLAGDGINGGNGYTEPVQVVVRRLSSDQEIEFEHEIGQSAVFTGHFDLYKANLLSKILAAIRELAA